MPCGGDAGAYAGINDDCGPIEHSGQLLDRSYQ